MIAVFGPAAALSAVLGSKTAIMTPVTGGGDLVARGTPARQSETTADSRLESPAITKCELGVALVGGGMDW
jgi:hypothetical protein